MPIHDAGKEMTISVASDITEKKTCFIVTLFQPQRLFVIINLNVYCSVINRRYT